MKKCAMVIMAWLWFCANSQAYLHVNVSNQGPTGYMLGVKVAPTGFDWYAGFGVPTGYSTQTWSGQDMANQTVFIQNVWYSGGAWVAMPGTQWQHTCGASEHDYTCSYDMGSGQGPPPNFTWHIGITNTGAGGVGYTYNGPDGSTNTLYVPPGQTGNITITSTNAYDITFKRTDYDAAGNPIGTDFAFVPNTDPGWQDGVSSSTGWSDFPKPAVDTFSQTPTNLNITYSGNTNGSTAGPWALETTVQTGFSALRIGQAQGLQDIANRLGVSIGLLQTLAAHANDMVNVNGNLVSIKSVLDAINGDVSAIHTLCTTLSGQLTTGNGYLLTVANMTGATATNTAALGGKLDTVHSDMTSVNGSLTSILTDVGAGLTELGVIAAYNATMAPNSSIIATNTGYIAQLHSDIYAMDVDLQNFKSQENVFNGQALTAMQTIGTDTANLAGIHSDTTDIKSKTGLIYNDIDSSIKPNVLALVTGQSVLTNQVNLLTNLPALGEVTTNLLGQVKTNLGGISSNLGDMLGEVGEIRDVATNLAAFTKTGSNGVITSIAGFIASGSNQVATSVSQVNSNGDYWIAQITNSVGVDDLDPGGSEWLVTVAPGKTIDCNPMHHAGAADLAYVIRRAITWIISVAAVIWGLKVLHETLSSIMSIPKGSQLTIGGLWFMLASATLVIGIFVGAPIILMTWWHNNCAVFEGSLSINPFAGFGITLEAGSSNAIYMAFWLLGQFVPVNYGVLVFGTCITFYVVAKGVQYISGFMLRQADR